MELRRLIRTLATPLVVTAALLYFLIDALFLSVIKPVMARLAALPVFGLINRWIRGLGPYPSLVLFLVPVIGLEPLKPVGLYWLASGHAVAGVALIAVAEILKVTIVERLFHINRDKLLSIPAFAWAYGLAMRWIGWLKALPAWQWVVERARRIRLALRDVWRSLRA